MKRKKVCKDNDQTGSQQLEVKSKSDQAWYNATVEVLADTVRVQFDGFLGHDEIWDVSYLRKHAGNIRNVIRLTSPQLQDPDCASVVEDMVVCARHVLDADASGEDGVIEELKYFDAMITKVTTAPHTTSLLGEEVCNCIFEAYWITGPDRKKRGKHDSSVILSCADTCTLNPGDVELHPVVKNIRQLLDSRARGARPSKQPVKELPNSGKAQTKTSSTSKTGERRKCSPIPSQPTEELDSNRTFTDLTPRRESRSRKEKEVRAPEMFQQSLRSDTARRAVEAKTANSSPPIESEDLSARTVPAVAKKRARLDGRKQKSEHPIPRTKEKKNAAGRSSKADASKASVPRMRGSVAEPPAWFKPPGGS